MSGNLKCVYKGSENEIIEKKSRFIANIFPVSSEEEALEYVESMRKKYWDAKHNCYAFVIGEKNEVQRYSDDGEPSQTAGKPMLDVIVSHEIHNVVVVVTRYFGGVLLGTGGLVRAYQRAVIEGLEHCLIIEKVMGKRKKIVTDYNGIGKIQYILAQHKIATVNTVYSDSVEIEVLPIIEQEAKLLSEVTEVTSGKAVIIDIEEVMFADIDGKIEIFEKGAVKKPLT